MFSIIFVISILVLEIKSIFNFLYEITKKKFQNYRKYKVKYETSYTLVIKNTFVRIF